MLQNTKKWLIISIGILTIIAIIVVSVIICKTKELSTQEKQITIGEIQEIDVLYYCATDIEQSKETIQISLSEEEQNTVVQKLKNWQFKNYSNSVKLDIIEQYEVTIDENNKFTFDNNTNNQEKQKYVKWYKGEKSFITAIPTEVFEIIVKRVDVPLTARNKKFETEEIVVQKGDKTIEINEKQYIEQIVSQCKYIAEITNMPEGSVQYRLDFGNGIKVAIYNTNGTLENTATGSVIKNVQIPNTIIQAVEQAINK